MYQFYTRIAGKCVKADKICKITNNGKLTKNAALDLIAYVDEIVLK